MFKDDYKKMNETITPGSELLRNTERSMEEIMNKKDAKRVSAKMALALALAGVLALTGVAFATGAIQSVFSWMGQRHVNDKVDYDKLDQLADQDLASASQLFDDEGEVAVEVRQAYYDGYQLIMGVQYNLKSRVEMGLDNERVAMTRPGDPSFCATKYDSQEGLPVPVTEEGENFPQSDILPAYMAQYMTDEQVRAFEKEYAEKGEAAVTVYTATMADKADIEGDENNEISMDMDERAAGDEPDSMYRYIEFDELTGDFVNRDELTVTFGLHQKVHVCRVDSEGVWTASARIENLLVPCTVQKNGQETRFAYGSFENEIYSAKAELRATDVRSRVIIDVVRPEEWNNADSVAMSIDDGEVDYVFSYRVLTVDGEWESAIDEIQATETGCHMEGVIELAEGQTEVILRPRYSKSGLVEGEDIVISLENGISSVK